MAENIKKRTVKDILNELFNGNTGALTKYAKVRHTRYELSLWQEYGLPLSKIKGQAKAHFAKRFLGVPIAEASQEELKKGLEKIGYAEDSCKRRCFRLVNELNEALKMLELDQVDPQGFIEYFTFNYHENIDEFGNPVTAPDYGFSIKHFHDSRNRKWFKNELDPLLKEGLILDLKEIERMARKKRKKAISFNKRD